MKIINKTKELPIPCKFYLTKENIEKVQEELFKRGFSYPDEMKYAISMAKYIHIDKNKIIRYSTRESSFLAYDPNYDIISEEFVLKYLDIL